MRAEQPVKMESSADGSDAFATTREPVADGRLRAVTNVSVLDVRARRQHHLLTAVALVSMAAFGTSWVRTVWTGSHPLVTALVGLALIVALAAWLARWFSLPTMTRPVHQPAATGLRVAAVTTFVASQEPLSMLEQTLTAMRDMRYEHDTWVLDEEDDAEVRALCARLGVLHFSRRMRDAYQGADGSYASATKYGNYNAWCDAVGYARYEVLAAFDPDHVPAPEYLERTLGFLTQATVAFVQTPQVYYNQDASLVARGAAEESYGYYSTHLMASYALGHTVVIGSHGVHRLAALRAVGGFPAHDAEDLYLTMVYRTAGWRGIYIPEVLALGMTPVTWSGYLQQQLRWARSLLDIKLRVLPRLAPHMSIVNRTFNLLHGALYMRALLVPLAYAGVAAMLLMNVAPAFLSPPAVIALVGLFLILALLARFQQRYYLDPARESGVAWRAAAMQLAKWPVFVRAVVEALTGRHVTYSVTSKSSQSGRDWSVAPVQLAVAATVALCWYVGTMRHGGLHASLNALALIAIVFPLALAATDMLPAADGFDIQLHPQRYRAMNAVGMNALD